MDLKLAVDMALNDFPDTSIEPSDNMYDREAKLRKKK
jgi:hypothetical protein